MGPRAQLGLTTVAYGKREDDSMIIRGPKVMRAMLVSVLPLPGWVTLSTTIPRVSKYVFLELLNDSKVHGVIKLSA